MVVCPGFTIVITPPHIHINVDELFIAGKLLTKTVGEPGAHGVSVRGTHGAGANITGGGLIVAGFAGLLHIPNGGMFTLGLLSITLAIGILVIALPGGTIREDGATPKAHLIIAPPQTHAPILLFSIENKIDLFNHNTDRYIIQVQRTDKNEC